ncbi:DNA/RNA helicase domain-containing protein [Helcococcus ovis]|uniref:DNA/RNA helicase domain-containing protein n=1 Tax=Helcococcus ovis TaxID=72026 RepID=UPI0038B984FB
MKNLNIYVYTQACIGLQNENYIQKFHRFITGSDTRYSRNEIECLDKLIQNIIEIEDNIEIFENFFYGYSIPNISKEFDLIKFDDQSIINREIKRKQKVEKIKNQLIQNRYYLRFLNKNTFLFTFLKEEDKLFKLENDELIETDFCELIKVLNNIKNLNLDIDNLFIPTNYLISPFNDTKRFINKEYFLTDEQNEKKHNIMKWIQENKKLICIQGKAGSGKSLLIYDISLDLISNNKNVVLVHCGILNKGHKKLNENNFNIISVKNIYDIDFSKIDYIIFDETQRIAINQFEYVINKIKETECVGVFSYDPRQTLSIDESKSKTIQILNSIKNVVKLKGRIRSNKDIYNFINCLFDKSKFYRSNFNDITIYYFNEYYEAINYLKKMVEKGWMYPEFSTSNYYENILDKYKINGMNSSHKVIGQEFDKVVVIIDENFYYNSENKLRSKVITNVKYDAMMMLYQNVTRVKNKLSIVVINNKEVLERLTKLINN